LLHSENDKPGRSDTAEYGSHAAVSKANALFPISPTKAPYLWLLAIPILFLCVGLLYPMFKMFLISIRTYDTATIIGQDLTLEHYGKLLFDPFYQRVLVRTLRLGLVVSLVCLVLGYPIAYHLARSRSAAKGWLVFLLLAPLMVGLVVRTYGWIILLGDNGSVNRLLIGMGLVERPIRLLNTELAVVIGLVEVLIPYMILPLISSLQKIDPSITEAAATQGARPSEVLRRVVLPLSLPGILSGTIIVFTLSAGAIVTPAVLGGQQMQTIGTLIYQVMTSTVNWPFGSALSFTILAAQALPIFLMFAFLGRGRMSR
jgi:putative spermidine/putrescine transport system permease protein